MSTKRPNAFSKSLEEAQKRAAQEANTQTFEQLNTQTFENSDIQTGKHPNTEMSKHSEIQTVKQPKIQTLGRRKNPAAQKSRIQSTYHLHPEDILAIEELQMHRFRTTGKKPEKSEIVAEAIQHLKTKTFEHLNS